MRAPFGDQETCPLKWFDYAASGRPIVVADTEAMQAVAPSWVPRFRPGDVTELARAVAACGAPALVERFAARPAELQHTWADRAATVDRFLASVTGEGA